VNRALPKPIATKQKNMNKEKLNINNEPQITEQSKQFGFEAIVRRRNNYTINADCLDILKHLPDKSFDFTVTDPPYNLGRSYDEQYNDNRNDYRLWCEQWFSEVKRLSKYAVVFSIGLKNLNMWYAIEQPAWIYNWFKGNNMGSGSKYTNIGVWEPYLVYGELKKKLGIDGRYVPVVPQPDASFHDCPKPLKLIQNIVEDFTDEDDYILDPFAGSFTTAVACLRTGRKHFSIEQSRLYYEKGLDRTSNVSKILNNDFGLFEASA